jgi:predicted amidohydrolase YtcJ
VLLHAQQWPAGTAGRLPRRPGPPRASRPAGHSRAAIAFFSAKRAGTGGPRPSWAGGWVWSSGWAEEEDAAGANAADLLRPGMLRAVLLRACVAHQHMAAETMFRVHGTDAPPISPDPDISCREARGLLRTGPAL